ncbi:MAG: hypothetical protein ACTSVZ_09705 [Promethearchaeota archaeon]
MEPPREFLLDDGSPPRKKIAHYIRSLVPPPRRLHNQKYSEIVLSRHNYFRSNNRVSFYLIEDGEFVSLRLFDTTLPIQDVCDEIEDKKERYQISSKHGLPLVTIAPKLLDLTIDNCNIHSLEDFPRYSQLIWLRITSLPLFSINSADLHLPNLRLLYLDNLNINSFEGINWYLPQLGSISVTGCKFRDFTFLQEIYEKLCAPYDKHLLCSHIGYIDTPCLRRYEIAPQTENFRELKVEINQNFYDRNTPYLPEICSLDGLTSLQITSLLSISVWYERDNRHKNSFVWNHYLQFPPFFQRWAEHWLEIVQREMEEADFEGFTFIEDDEGGYYPMIEDARIDFVHRKEDELARHIAPMVEKYEKTLPELLDAVQRTKHEGWPRSFSLELIERVVHECTISVRRSMLQVLPPEHPLHGLWRNDDSDSITLDNSLELLK